MMPYTINVKRTREAMKIEMLISQIDAYLVFRYRDQMTFKVEILIRKLSR